MAIENFESSPLNKISPFNRQNLKLKGFKIPHNLVFSLKKKTTSIKCVYNKKINMLFTKILKSYHYHFLGKITCVPKCTNY